MRWHIPFVTHCRLAKNVKRFIAVCITLHFLKQKRQETEEEGEEEEEKRTDLENLWVYERYDKLYIINAGVEDQLLLRNAHELDTKQEEKKKINKK